MWKKTGMGTLVLEDDAPYMRASILTHCGDLSVQAIVCLNNKYDEMIYSPYYVYNDVEHTNNNSVICSSREEAITLAKEWVEEHGNRRN